MKKEILFIAPLSKNLGGKATGGISRHVEDLSQELVNEQYIVTIYDYRLNKSFNVNGISVLGVPVVLKILYLTINIINGTLLKNGLNNLSFKDKVILALELKFCQKIIKKNNINIVHVHSLHRPITSFLRESFPDIKLIVTDHGFWQNNDVKKKKSIKLSFLKRNLNSADKIIYISNYALKYHKEYGFYQKYNNKYVFIPNPTSFSGFKVNSEERPNKVIFFNGLNKSIEIKNLKVLTKALLDDHYFDDCKLLAIADKNGRKHLKEINAKFEIVSLKAQSRRRVSELYLQSSVLVVPSKSESFGLVYIESIAHGTPIVGFEGTVREIENNCKVYVGEKFDSNKETSEDLSLKIKNVLDKSIDRVEIHNQIKDIYNWENNIQNFMKIYNF